jgi:hypothetical protein
VSLFYSRRQQRLREVVLLGVKVVDFGFRYACLQVGWGCIAKIFGEASSNGRSGQQRNIYGLDSRVPPNGHCSNFPITNLKPVANIKFFVQRVAHCSPRSNFCISFVVASRHYLLSELSEAQCLVSSEQSTTVKMLIVHSVP